jgi:hypothetical protein
MQTPFDYLAMARDCLQQAESEIDDARRDVLIQAAKLYTQYATRDANTQIPESADVYQHGSSHA